jgi:integrase
MLVQHEAYFNFVNSINSDVTRRNYEYCLSKFLRYCNLDLESLIKLPQNELSSLIIKYLVSQKISSQYKVVIMASIKHACEMNDVVLNWKKLNKFIKSEKTLNEINGKDRGYTHEEIQKILEYSDQRLRTAFLVLASSGIRIGALQSIRIDDLERIDNLYKITVYRGDKEEYYTFTTPECTKEIDSYLEFRERRGEKITQDSYL